MNQFEMVFNYKDNQLLRLSFNQLAKSSFGIDFEDYYQKGFWNNKFICYSYHDEGKVISNVSVSFLDVVLNGGKISAVQIGTVMTHPEYRGQGLAGSLLKYVLEKYQSETELIFLFANKTVLEFYPKFGFKPIKQNLFMKNIGMIKTINHDQPRRLAINNENDLNLVLRLSSKRKPISRVLGVDNAQYLLFFYWMYVFRNDFYYLERLDAIAVYRIEEEEIHIYDVISQADLSFADIIERIASNDVKRAIFHFTPDFKDLETERISYEDDQLFVKTESVKIPENLMYPAIAHA
ncbi:MAG: GNAT family N-acetyltransferase [Bacteroidota bacterium]